MPFKNTSPVRWKFRLQEKKYALCIGNGLNRAVDDKAWTTIIDDTRHKYGLEASPFYTHLPLEFERLYIEAARESKVKSAYAIKKEIAHSIPNVNDLLLHKKFTDLPIQEYITTNYDYYLEISVNNTFNRRKFTANTKEIKYSLFRHFKLKGKRFWHIHGEINNPDSICLGYDHYCTYLSKIISHLTQPMANICKKPFLKYLLEGGSSIQDSWPLFFFTHDIFIFGLTMSFLEMDLWWMLSFRAKFATENPQYKISNQIHYFYAVHSNNVDDEQISLLESIGIELHPIPLVRKNWMKMYENILANIRKIVKP